MITYPLTYRVCVIVLCCIIVVRIIVNYVKMLLSVGPGSLKSIIEALSYKPEVWSLKEVSREGLIKDAFELHCGTWKYTQRLLRSKTQNICLCCFHLTICFYLPLTTLWKFNNTSVKYVM